MKILQITPYFLPHTGGVEQYVFNLSKYLVKQGHQVEVITSNIPVGLKNEKIQGINIIRMKSYGEILRNPITPSSFLKDIHDFDIINVHNIYALTSFFATIKNYPIKTPLVLTHHGKAKFDSHIKNSAVRFYEMSIAKKLLNRIDCSIALTKSDADFLSTLGMKKEHIRIIPNGIDIPEFKQFHHADPPLFRESMGLKNKFVLLYVGEISDRKGIKYLIGAMAEIKNHIPHEEIALIIIGSGPELRKNQVLVKNLNLDSYISFKGRIPFSELIEFYNTSDVFILPTLSEGMPTAILEALFFNLPVITSDIPPLRESFNNLALFVPPENEKELAGQILTLANNPTYTDKINSDTKSYVEAHYSWSILAKKYEDIYQKLYHSHKK